MSERAVSEIFTCFLFGLVYALVPRCVQKFLVGCSIAFIVCTLADFYEVMKILLDIAK